MVHRIAIAVLLTTVWFTGNSCTGQEPSPSYEHLKPLEWLTGDWVGEYVATFDLEPVKKGDRVTTYASGRWMFNKTIVVTDFQLEINGKKMPDTHEIVGWDPEKKTPIHWIYSALGAGTGVWTEVGDKAVLHWSVDGKDGKLEGTSTIEKVDDNTHIWQASKVTLGGERLPDWSKVTMRRRTGTPAGDLWTAYRDAIVGNWLGTGTLGRDSKTSGLSNGDEFTFRLTWKPELDGAVVLGEGEFRVGAKDYTSGVRSTISWDPATQQVRLLSCWSNGDIEEILIQRQVKTGFLGTYVANFVDQPVERSRIRADFPDGQSAVLKFLDGPRKGEVLSSWKRQ